MLLDRGGIGGEPIKRDQGRERREDSEEREEGAAGGDDGKVVASAFAPYPLGDLPSAAQRDVVGTPGIAAIGVWLAAHVGEKITEAAKRGIMLPCRSDFQP